jgi:CheY-like chemotaxis protein
MNLLATREYFPKPAVALGCVETILVVEDERIVREATCQVLSQLDYCVLAAENATAAREIFLDHSRDIDLLLCDAVLPDEERSRTRARSLRCFAWPNSCTRFRVPATRDIRTRNFRIRDFQT